MRITKFEEFIEKSVPYFIGLVILVILLVIGSCDQEKGPTIKSESGAEYKIVVIEDCEYIVYEYCSGCTNGLFSITHKGNCKNHKPCE